MRGQPRDEVAELRRVNDELKLRLEEALAREAATAEVLGVIGSLALKGLSQPVSAFNVPASASQPTLRVIEGGPQSAWLRPLHAPGGHPHSRLGYRSPRGRPSLPHMAMGEERRLRTLQAISGSSGPAQIGPSRAVMSAHQAALLHF